MAVCDLNLDRNDHFRFFDLQILAGYSAIDGQHYWNDGTLIAQKEPQTRRVCGSFFIFWFAITAQILRK